MKSFTLDIISQEKPLVSKSVHSLTAMTQSGQITVMADHSPLFSRLVPGELIYRDSTSSQHFAVTGGFIDINPNSHVTVLVDSATHANDINLAKVEAAIKNARDALKNAPDQKTSLKIELQLRHALLQADIAKKHRHN